MKFLVDAQLPKSLSDYLRWQGFDPMHTLDLPEKNQTKDERINEISLNEDRIIISKDVDFLESLLIKSKPKKLILIQTGNIPNKNLIDIFSKNLNLIIEMIKRSNLVEISKTDIAEHE